MSLAATEQVNWQEWSRRWDAQQTYLVVRREERFRVMLAIARQVLGRAPLRVLDLACGTGDLARRVLAEFPEAHVVGLDADPLLLAIANGAHGDAGGRLRWLRADLRDPEWPNALRAFAGFELVVSSTALHWLPTPALKSVYRALYELVAPGGMVLNADVMPPLPAGKLASAADALRSAAAREAQQSGNGERYAEWWDAIKREPALAELCRERASLFEDHPEDLELPSADLHVSTLKEVGFSEAGVMWRFFDYSVVAAVKPG
jgi:SAM-dependent methyltransferase